jgi:hypothetical protein
MNFRQLKCASEALRMGLVLLSDELGTIIVKMGVIPPIKSVQAGVTGDISKV